MKKAKIIITPLTMYSIELSSLRPARIALKETNGVEASTMNET